MTVPSATNESGPAHVFACRPAVPILRFSIGRLFAPVTLIGCESQRLFDIVPDVFCVFNAYSQPDQSVGNPH